ncbi:hypothetical protein [Adhaeribacter pallidiroseus]|uniref:Uncharacterized protein n=1 Tax=Adhaeribacter pallidiroseus TaxID=2072847 RepID=A0A369QQ44_9BACT|nr:hypothetical protein [Adhaeribacter pallidiroseus]RDC65795.1 hypothetical protein AHMF7616_04425 [Adhaeribacter pallidiroseus]
MSSTDLTTPVLEKMQRLTFSDDNIYDFFSLANRAYLLVYLHGSDGKKEHLDKIKKVIDTQIRPLLEEELTMNEKKNLFDTAKTNIEAYIKAYAQQAK